MIVQQLGESYKFKVTQPKWFMSIGDFTIVHTTEYSAWRAFWLRFMGWKVTKLENNGEQK